MANYKRVECKCCGGAALWPAGDSVKNGGTSAATGKMYAYEFARCDACRRYCRYGRQNHEGRPLMESYRTAPHRLVEKLLRSMSISFESEHAEFTPYRLDIYIPEWHLAIEVDGPNHSAAKDAERDKVLLERYGVPTLRLPASAGVAEKQARFERIEEFLVVWAPTTKERLRQWRSRETS